MGLRALLCLTVATILSVSFQAPVRGQSVQRPEVDISVEAALAAFEVADGYEIQLFADETDGIANPVCIRWDAAGRLWALCTWAYPQLDPTTLPDDKLIILEDTDGDGRADQTTVFADGLDMPTGFALGDGGAYIGQATEILFLQDTDGDDRADTQRTIFTGFGTGDTHQNVNSFTWSPGGDLFFLQGMHTFSRVETPWGIVVGNSAGMWKWQTREHRLSTYLMPNLLAGNPWGICWDNWGRMFVKANGRQLYYTSPTVITDYLNIDLEQTLGVITETSSKSMSIEYVENSHLPDDLQGKGLIAGYYVHEVTTVALNEQGSGFERAPSEVLVNSSHSSFRPVEIRIGPDGAIYVADFCNPIIGHYQASFRHPHRDYTHGRVWRIVAKDRPLLTAPNLPEMSADELCEQLESTERWNRYHAKRLLADRETEEVVAAVQRWVDGLDANDPKLEHKLYEAIGVFESHDCVNLPLLNRLITATSPYARAYAARVVGHWQAVLDSPLEMLATLANDPHPQVRLEAVVACSEIHTAESVTVATQATSHPLDKWLNYSLKQTIHSLAEHWEPALQAGTLAFAHPDHLSYTLSSHGGPNVIRQARAMLASETLGGDTRDQLLDLVARVGDQGDLDFVLRESDGNASRMQALVTACQLRDIRPTQREAGERLLGMLGSEDAALRTAAVRLLGVWNLQTHTEVVSGVVDNSAEDAAVRAAACLALGELSEEQCLARFDRLIESSSPEVVRAAAVEAVAKHDLSRATTGAVQLMNQTGQESDVNSLMTVLTQRRGAIEALTAVLNASEVSADTAKLVSRWTTAVGYDDAELMTVLTTIMGIETNATVEYSEAFVTELLNEVYESGNTVAGREVFISSLANCTACHRDNSVEQDSSQFFRGPDLSVVGAGLQAELIVESIVWPSRQLKEGYESTTLLLDDGRMISGYQTSETDSIVTIRELSTGEYLEIPVNSIEERSARGTIMPTGIINTLTRQELRDLVAYLTSRDGNDDAQRTNGS